MVETKREWEDDDSPLFVAVKKTPGDFEVPFYLDESETLSTKSMSGGPKNVVVDVPIYQTPKKLPERPVNLAACKNSALKVIKPVKINPTFKQFSMNWIANLGITVTVWIMCLWIWAVLWAVEKVTGIEL